MDAPDRVQLATTGTAYHHIPATPEDLLVEMGSERLQNVAGWQPPHRSIEVEVAKPDEQPSCTRAAERWLRYILYREPQMLVEWLVLVADAGQRVPHVHLPALLAQATEHKSLRIYVLHVLDMRGKWLAQQHPAVDWLETTPRIRRALLRTCQQWRDADTVAVMHQTKAYNPYRRLDRDRIHDPLLEHLANYGGIWSDLLARDIVKTLLVWLEKGSVTNNEKFDRVLTAVAYGCPLTFADSVMSMCEALTEREEKFRQTPSKEKTRTDFRYFNNSRWHRLLRAMAAIFAGRRDMHAAIHPSI